MSRDKLALLGGTPIISQKFSPYNFMDEREKEAVIEVLDNGVLSGFVGTFSDNFYGGQFVRQFEENWSDYFAVKYAISVNSNTSGLICALGAVGVEPGDEVIVSTWSMSASATSILVWNAIPIFADIESDTFNMDPHKIENLITERTKAIVLPDIFGHAAELSSIIEIARKKGLFVIEDCAQAPGADYYDKKVGTVADIGVYSLNYHKHIHTGEGGVCVTNNSEFARRMQLIRNHGEAVVEGMQVDDISNIIGFNFRLTEIQAAIGIEQLKKLPDIVTYRQRCADLLSNGLQGLLGLRLPVVKEHCSHVYYTYPLILNLDKIGVPREWIYKAIKAEGFTDIAPGYVNIHTYPMYQKKIAYGKNHYPWSAPFYKGNASYEPGICPVAETLHNSSFLNILLCLSKFTEEDMCKTVEVFQKVWDQLPALRNDYERTMSDCVA